MFNLNKRPFYLLVACVAILPVSTVALAEAQTVVPEREETIARELGVEGPRETHGIESSETLGSVSLGGDFSALEGRYLRARRVTVAPGAVVGVHQHTSRPGVLYMLEGELTEVRNDADGPVTRKKGDTSFEKEGVIHWWRNDSGSRAVAFVVDIVPEELTR